MVARTALISDPRIRSMGVAGRVLANMPEKDAGAGLMDRLIHGGYEVEGMTLLTFDRGAARLAGARLLV